MYTMNDYKQDLALGIQLLVDAGLTEIASKKITPVLNKRTVTRLGCCFITKYKYQVEKVYKIELNYNFAQIVNHQEVMHTILHELCHTLEGCNNHGPNWKHKINIINQKYGFNITARHKTNSEEMKKYGEFLETKSKSVKGLTSTQKYEFTCTSCGQKYFYSKMCQAVKGMKMQSPNAQAQTYRRYTCSQCNNGTFDFKQNF